MGPTHPSTRTLRDEAAQRRLCQTLSVMKSLPIRGVSGDKRHTPA